ncbi:hypothetical protein ABVV53_01780 [Novosphingobium sp. RD2P27]|uniref:MBL fold metallo-hydrolase n=1 Tax=Novosphingobium kalidii TaxID=3230299 RepID=A0ABV2CX69_9SPHN
MKQLADNFWNFRGSFKIGGVLDIGTQMSLVRRSNGRFLMLDSYAVSDADKDSLLALTDNGAAVDAIINVHPFHTLYCRVAHRLAPTARLIGTRRHREQVPELPWESGVIEDVATQAEFAAELDFAVPSGLELVTSDDSVHASSVLARHRASGIVHVDDTLNVLAAPGLLKHILPQSRLRFHPMLGKALQARPGAANAFAGWARDLASQWAGTPIVCAAHSAVRRLPANGWRDEVSRALSGVEKTLAAHRSQHG